MSNIEYKIENPGPPKDVLPDDAIISIRVGPDAGKSSITQAKVAEPKYIPELVKGDHPLLYHQVEAIDFKSISRLELNLLENDLLMALSHYKGLGLSANQIGKNKRAFVMGAEDGKLQTFFNPEITFFSETKSKMEEGCLSFPGLFLKIERPSAIRAKWQDINGFTFEHEFVGMTARVYQHEMDHMNGITIQMYATPFELRRAREKQEKLLKKMSREKKRYESGNPNGNNTRRT